MSVKSEPDIEVNVESLDSDALNEQLRASTAVLREMMTSDDTDINIVVEVGTEEYITGDLPASGSVEKGHACKYCGKLYKSASTLQMHARLKHPCDFGDRVEVRCASCDKTYASLLSLQKHQRYMHRHAHRCGACYRTFETRDKLAEHATNCVKSERPCLTCGRMYDSQLSLRNHVKYKHPEVKTYWCGLCRRAFTTSRRLVNHISMIHPSGIACGSCKRTFNSVAALQSHVLYKHSENGHRCSQCKKVFASHGSLARHLAKNHKVVVCEGGKYCCGVCEAQFLGSRDVIQHVMEKHTGIKEDIDTLKAGTSDNN
ncbi:zinc finger protein 62-like [Ostrinia furnacalis]|uniref:zinc finger protein 62-like n=1 Tax=Ostrinia furnacalis TaxID=93504 RepID=UPI00103C0896|nr:zinc finger protein 62-like [Ostrinia furnacalis]XP_028174871.1 zinc finger protein 62-like [Ostrinia furnacalis]